MGKFCIKFITIFLCIIFSTTSFGQLTDVDRQGIINKNLYDPWNGGFESGVGSWTASGGSLAGVTSGSNLLVGKGSATWDSNSASQTLSGRNLAVPNGWKGINGLFQCLIMVPSGTATHKIQVYDGTNVLAEQTIASGTVPTYQSLNFIFPSSGNIRGRLISVASNEPSITIDDCYLGAAANLTNVSQAQFIGSAKIAGTTSCIWTNTGSALDAMGATAACPGPTVILNPGPGVIQTTDTNLPKFTVNSLAPGYYHVEITFYAYADTSGQYGCFAISDGTTTMPALCALSPAGSRGSAFTLIGDFYYADSGNRSFEVYGGASSGTITIEGTPGPPPEDMNFSISRFPSSPQLATTLDQLPASWSGYHQSDCLWTSTNTAFAWVTPTDDGSCTFTELTNSNFGTVASTGSKTPGITFTPKRAGKYFVCVSGTMKESTNNGGGNVRLIDGSTNVLDVAESAAASTTYAFPFKMCGILNATSTAAQTATIQLLRDTSGAGTLSLYGTTNITQALNWSIFALDQQYPFPQYVGAVTNSGTGQIRVEAAKLACSSSSSITSQLNGSNWVSSIGNVSSGACAVTLTSGVFSTTPICLISSNGGGNINSVTSSSATSISVSCITDAGVNCTAHNVEVMCMGTK